MKKNWHKSHVFDYLKSLGWSTFFRSEHLPLELELSNVELYQPKKQKFHGYSLANQALRKSNTEMLDYYFLDYLKTYPEQIPEEWKGKYIYFFGTTLIDGDDQLRVPVLHWDESKSKWINQFGWVNSTLNNACYAAILKIKK